VPVKLFDKDNRIKVNFWVDKDLWRDLQELARYEDRSASSLMRQVLAAFLRDQEKVDEAIQERETKKKTRKKTKSLKTKDEPRSLRAEAGR
jgi:predicted transcriptional regulator